MNFSEKINALLNFFLMKKDNEILQYWITINDIALLLH